MRASNESAIFVVNACAGGAHDRKASLEFGFGMSRRREHSVPGRHSRARGSAVLRLSVIVQQCVVHSRPTPGQRTTDLSELSHALPARLKISRIFSSSSLPKVDSKTRQKAESCQIQGGMEIVDCEVGTSCAVSNTSRAGRVVCYQH